MSAPEATTPARGAAPSSPPIGPGTPGPIEALWAGWRWLRRMSTAIWLLFALAAASVVATFVPQERVTPTTVADWRAGVDGPGVAVAGLFDALDLFDVYGSVWFAVLTALLFVSLTGCLIPRGRAFWRDLRRAPPRGRHLERLTHRATLHSPLAVEEALTAAEGLLARRRYRTRRSGAEQTASGRAQLAAERGRAREGGSLLFHASFYLLLLGIVLGQGAGFIGQVNVAEGQAFTDTRISYDLAEPGPLFGLDDHDGFTVRLEAFEATYHADGTPERFVSRVSVLEDGQEVITGRTVEVNDRLTHGGMHLYQMRFGMAPRVVLTAGGNELFDEQVMLGQDDGGTWSGVAKVSSADPQIALEVLLVPDFAVDADGEPLSRGPEPANPRLFANLWVGDLGLERPLPATAFDREGGERVDAAALDVGESAALLGGGLELGFPEMTMWSGFQVAHQPGRPLLVAASVVLLAGLVPSLYAYRRRVWVEAEPAEGGTRLVVAGVALHRTDAFEAAFPDLLTDLAEVLGADRDASADPAATTDAQET